MSHKKRVCVDLDGVLASYDGWSGISVFGEPIPGAVDFTKELSSFADVVIYTTRCSEVNKNQLSLSQLYEIVKDYLDLHGFEYSEIYCGQGKPIASAYIDDRAVVCDPQSWVGPEMSYRAAVMSAKALCGEIREAD